MSDTTTTPPAASTDIATPAVAVPVVAATPPVVASPVVPPAAPAVAAPRVLNPYASPKVAAAPVDPRVAALEASAAEYLLILCVLVVQFYLATLNLQLKLPFYLLLIS